MNTFYNDADSFENSSVKEQTWWKMKNPVETSKPFKVLIARQSEVIASSTISLETNTRDSFLWMSPIREFLNKFVPCNPPIENHL